MRDFVVSRKALSHLMIFHQVAALYFFAQDFAGYFLEKNSSVFFWQYRGYNIIKGGGGMHSFQQDKALTQYALISVLLN